MIVLWLLACGPPPRTWAPIDPVALQDRLDNPTAPQPEPAAVAGELAGILRAGGDLRSLPTALEAVLAEPGTEIPAAAGDDVVSGTSAFFEVACPGDAGAPDPDFGRGEIRVESPVLRDDGSLPALGPIYLTLSTCELGDTVADGELRGEWLAGDQRLLAEGLLDLVTVEGALVWDAAFAADRAELALSYTLPRGTVTLAFDAEVVRVTFSDGAYACTPFPPVTCTPVAPAR